MGASSRKSLVQRQGAELWCKANEWKFVWIHLLDQHRMELDMSSVDLDGSHITALRGGGEVGYQGRKKRKTTNALYLTDKAGNSSSHVLSEIRRAS